MCLRGWAGNLGASVQKLKISPAKIQAGFTAPEWRDTHMQLHQASFPTHLRHPKLLIFCAASLLKSWKSCLHFGSLSSLGTSWKSCLPKDDSFLPCMEGNPFPGIRKQSINHQGMSFIFFYLAKGFKLPFTWERECFWQHAGIAQIFRIWTPFLHATKGVQLPLAGSFFNQPPEMRGKYSKEGCKWQPVVNADRLPVTHIAITWLQGIAQYFTTAGSPRAS